MEKLKNIFHFFTHCSEIKSDPDKRDYLVSNKKIESIGWKPKYDLDFGIIELNKLYKMLNLNNFSNV